MPYLEGQFDVIFSFGVIEHNENGPKEALQEFFRILRPGGIAIVTVPQDCVKQRKTSQYQFAKSATETAFKKSFFQYFMTETELNGFLENEGFNIIEHGTTGKASLALLSPFLYSSLPYVFRRILNLFVGIILFKNLSFHGMIYSVGKKSS